MIINYGNKFLNLDLLCNYEVWIKYSEDFGYEVIIDYFTGTFRMHRIKEDSAATDKRNQVEEAIRNGFKLGTKIINFDVIDDSGWEGR